MKGVIFNLLENMVHDVAGEDAWEETLDTVQPKSEGIYTSAETYPDQELFEMVGFLSKKLGFPAEVLLRTFGKYMIPKLATLYPNFFEGKTYFEFLESVHDIIHVEVRKLLSGAELPTLKTERQGENLMVKYHSNKKLCALAEGLILGAAHHYGVTVELEHKKCMHHDHEECHILVLPK